MNKIVKALSEEAEADIEGRDKSKTLMLVGDPESQYLMAIKRRCGKLGLKCSPYNGLTTPMSECVFVVNHDERDTEWASPLVCEHDIDRIKTKGTSCCAKACVQIIRYGFPGRNRLVTIAGRGHSQKGLCEALRAIGIGVLSVCSDSDPMALRVAGAHSDIIVNTSNDVIWEKPPHDSAVILDVCGGLEKHKDRYAHYISQRDIGALNISILLNRFVRC